MSESPIMQAYERQIDKTTAEFCIAVVKNPLCYFSEADLQLLLAEALRKYAPFRKPVPTQVPRGRGSRGTHGTPLLHREYGGGDGTRIDIVILDPEKVRQIDDPNLTIRTEYLKPLFAFELGTEKTQDTAIHLENDLKKLQQAGVMKGYIIYFFKDTTVAKTGSDRRTRTEERINRMFRVAFARWNTPGYENVKILAILLRTGRNQRAIRGKCEVLDGEKWVKVNVSRGDSLRNAIMSQLR